MSYACWINKMKSSYLSVFYYKIAKTITIKRVLPGIDVYITKTITFSQKRCLQVLLYDSFWVDKC